MCITRAFVSAGIWLVVNNSSAGATTAAAAQPKPPRAKLGSSEGWSFVVVVELQPGAGATRDFWCHSLSGLLFCSVGRAAGFSGPGAERLDGYRLGWMLVSSRRFGSAALRVSRERGLRSGSRSCHVAGLSCNVKGKIFFLTKSALRAAVASCVVGKLEFGLITKYYYCTARRNSPLLQKASTFTGPQLWPAGGFQPLIIGNSALLLVFRCDCRESPHQLPLPALFLRL